MGLRRSGQYGQTTVEYLGLVMVVVAIVGGLVATGLGAELTSKIQSEVCKLTGGGECGGGAEASDGSGGAGGADGDGDGDGPDAAKDPYTPGDGRTADGAEPVTPAEAEAEKEYRQALKELEDAEGDYEREKQRAVEAAKKLAKILADELGITDAVKCFTEGDPSACSETAVNVVLSLLGSLPAKVLKKYGWPTEWKKGKALVESILKHGGDVVGGAKGMWKAKKKADRLREKVEDLKKKLPQREKKPDAGKPVTCTRKHSFLPGTPVLLADGTRRPIEDVRLGDRVTATDPYSGLTAARPVTAVITTEDDKHFTRLTVSVGGRPETITATDTHPFWLADRHRWADAGDIRPGAALRTPDGRTLTVTDTDRYTQRQRTHDLTVAGIHTYYVGVGTRGALVHNNDPCVNWSAKSVKTFGHTFKTHGAGAKNTKALTDRARSTGNSQGQWLDDKAAAEFLKSVHVEGSGPRSVRIPDGLGQVIMPDGSIVQARAATLVPGPNGLYRTAFPIIGPN